MNIDTENLQKKFGKSLIFKENLSKYSWFNLGGPAEIFFRPQNINQLKEFLSEIKNTKYNINILGAGSNTLIRDSGVKGVVVKLSSSFSHISLLKQDTIEVGAAALDRKVSEFAKNNGISEMEFLSCIPGSIGGTIKMNSGCYGSDISKVLLSIKVLDNLGHEHEINNNEIKFGYRSSDLSEDFIILSARLRGNISSKELIEKKQNELIERKKRSQPSQIKTGGSTFKNNEDKKAWELIKESGCEKFSVGNAKISEKHCNFFVNDGKAKALEIEMLIDKVKKEVHKKTGVNLELEIKIIGDEK
jgi:UDP-N-acetylmuramate dehydrogenase